MCYNSSLGETKVLQNGKITNIHRGFIMKKAILIGSGMVVATEILSTTINAQSPVVIVDTQREKSQTLSNQQNFSITNPRIDFPRNIISGREARRDRRKNERKNK